MKRLPVLLLCLTCVALGAALKASFDTDEIAALAKALAPRVIAVLLAGLLLVLVGVWAGVLLARRWARKALQADTNMTEAEIITGLVDHFTTPEGVPDPTPEERKRAAMVNLGLWLARRAAVQFSFNAMITVVGGLVGAATLFLLYEQNVKLDEQNRRISLQTDANITQSVLLEGARRASLSADAANLFEAIRNVPEQIEERCPNGAAQWDNVNCWEWRPGYKDLIKRYYVPSDLKFRIISFAQRNTPYRLAVSQGAALDFEAPLRDQFQFPDLSPERGQLLETLALSQVYVGAIDFSSAQLVGAELTLRDMITVLLPKADLRNARLNDADMRAADLLDATLAGARMERINLEGARLQNADLQGAWITQANLQRANLLNADLRGTNLAGTNFSQAMISGANFEGARTFSNTDFTDVWAWSDQPPIGFSGNVDVLLCDYPGGTWFRGTKPRDCKAGPFDDAPPTSPRTAPSE